MKAEFLHAADLPRARRALADVCRRMYERGHIVAKDGNVSVRIGDRKLLVTPTGQRKSALRPEDMVLCDLEGAPLRSERGRPSAEIAMHVAVYAHRPEARAVVHAHPPCAVAHTIAGLSLSDPLVPEAFCELGPVPTIPYTTPTTDEVPRALVPMLGRGVAFLLERHGSITIGETVDEAFDRLEILEHTARMSLMSRVLAPGGRVEGLSPERIEALRAIVG